MVVRIHSGPMCGRTFELELAQQAWRKATTPRRKWAMYLQLERERGTDANLCFDHWPTAIEIKKCTASKIRSRPLKLYNMMGICHTKRMHLHEVGLRPIVDIKWVSPIRMRERQHFVVRFEAFRARPCANNYPYLPKLHPLTFLSAPGSAPFWRACNLTNWGCWETQGQDQDN